MQNWKWKSEVFQIYRLKLQGGLNMILIKCFMNPALVDCKSITNNDGYSTGWDATE